MVKCKVSQRFLNILNEAKAMFELRECRHAVMNLDGEGVFPAAGFSQSTRCWYTNSAPG